MAQKLFSVIASLAATCVLLSAAGAQTFTGVSTQHNDNSRTGQNLAETTLTPANVNRGKFGKVFSFAVDGQIYAQPLYVPNVTIKGVVHNVVYVATEYDSLYAFDADGETTTPLWRRSFISPAQGVVPVPCGTDGSTTDISCNVFPYYGITGTPVIDLSSNAMYLIVRTAETTAGVTTYYQRLHAVNIQTGSDKAGSPVVIQGSVPGTGAGSIGGMVAFDSLADIQRAGLMLLNGTVYIGWAGAGHGWIMGYNAKTLQQTAIFNTAPNAVLGGIWQTGNGFVADSSGNIYVAVGDALFDASTGGVDYGDALLKLNSSLEVLDYFTPMDQGCRQLNDLDLGSAGPVILPTQEGSYPNELLISGKGGNPCDSTGASPMYLLDQGNLGKYNPTQDQVIQELSGAPGGYWSSPAFWQGTGNGASYLYLAGTGPEGNSGDTLDQYKLVQGTLSAGSVSQNVFNTGATPSVSSNGTTNGIVWAIERTDPLDQRPGDSPAVLYAYDAVSLAMLYNSNQQTTGRDQPGCGNKFQTPTIANGRVYVGTQTQLDVYGILGSQSGPAVYLSSVCHTFPNTPIGQKSAPLVITIKNIGTGTLTFTSIDLTGVSAKDFVKKNKCGTSLAAGATCRLSVAFKPSTGLPETAFITISDNAVGSPHNIGLVGTGEQPSVKVNPPFLAFGKEDVNITSPPQIVTVANSGNLPVTINGFTFTGTNANLFSQTNDCPASLAVNTNCTVNVSFTPVVTGQFSADLSVTDDAAGSPQLVSLTGVGVRPNAVITSPNPPQIHFGQIAVGSSSASQPVTLLNNGGGTLFISSITFTGPNPTEFSETDNCDGSVPSGGTCTLDVTFTPTVIGLGEAFMNINDNSDPSPQQVSLSGDGT